MRKNALFIGVISLAIILDSCATITRGTTEATREAAGGAGKTK